MRKVISTSLTIGALAIVGAVAGLAASATVQTSDASAHGTATSTYTTQVTYSGNCKYTYYYRLYRYGGGSHWHYSHSKRTCYPY